QYVATVLVRRADTFRVFLAFAEGDDRRDLDGLESAVIEIAFDAREGGNHTGVAEAEADAPSRHFVALRHGKDFDREVFRAWHLEDAGGLVAIETVIGVGEIVNDEGAVFARQFDNFREERQVHAR